MLLNELNNRRDSLMNSFFVDNVNYHQEETCVFDSRYSPLLIDECMYEDEFFSFTLSTLFRFV